MTTRFPNRTLFLVTGGISAAFLIAAFALEYLAGMEPCPLCWVQRWAFVLIAAVAGMALLHRPVGWGSRVYAMLLGAASLGGAAIAIRHIQVQLSPPTIGCGVGWSTLVDRLPFHELFLRAMQGSADCAEVDAFFGIPLPWWTLAAYFSFAVAAFAVATGALRLR